MFTCHPVLCIAGSTGAKHLNFLYRTGENRPKWEKSLISMMDLTLTGTEHLCNTFNNTCLEKNYYGLILKALLSIMAHYAHKSLYEHSILDNVNVEQCTLFWQLDAAGRLTFCFPHTHRSMTNHLKNNQQPLRNVSTERWRQCFPARKPDIQSLEFYTGNQSLS